MAPSIAGDETCIYGLMAQELIKSLLQDADAALAAFDQAFPDQEESDNAWVALAVLEKGKNADQQLDALWQGLGTRKSADLLKLAIERKLKPTGA